MSLRLRALIVVMAGMLTSALALPGCGGSNEAYTLLDRHLEARQDIDRAVELGVNVIPVAKKYFDFSTLKEAFEEFQEQQ